MFRFELNYCLLNNPSKKVLTVLKPNTIVVIDNSIPMAKIKYANHIEPSILFKALKAMFNVIGETNKSTINTNNCLIPLFIKSVLMLILVV
ncbi:MAG: hypothetical protein ACI8WA_001117 [Polaribacter sp.]|jgi:hypothetical protein